MSDINVCRHRLDRGWSILDDHDEAFVARDMAREAVAMSGFACQECDHAFRTVRAAERAAFGAHGCPKCGSSDIDLGRPLKLTDAEVHAKVYAALGCDHPCLDLSGPLPVCTRCLTTLEPMPEHADS